MREWWSKIRALLGGRDTLSSDLGEEVEAHLEMEVRENVARGMSLAEARKSARRGFGNTTQIQETRARCVAVRDSRNLLQGRRLCRPFHAQESRLRSDGSAHARSRHRRQHGHFHRHPRRIAEAARLSSAGSAGPYLHR